MAEIHFLHQHYRAPAIVTAANLGSGVASIATETTLPVFLDDNSAPTTNFWLKCASLADPAVPVTAYLTSTQWAAISREICSLPAELLMDPTRPPTPETFAAMRLTKNFTIVNSGTEDQIWCDKMNWPVVRACSWREREARFHVRPGEKTEVESTDAESTHNKEVEIVK